MNYLFNLINERGLSTCETGEFANLSEAIKYGAKILRLYVRNLNPVYAQQNPQVVITGYKTAVSVDTTCTCTIAAIPVLSKGTFSFLPHLLPAHIPTIDKEYIELWTLCNVLLNDYLKHKLNSNEDDEDDDIIEVWDLTVYGGVEDASISIDLYNEDATPVCEGLHQCAVTLLDGTETTGGLFSLYFNPDYEDQPLSFNLNQGTLPNGDLSVIDVSAERVPASVLHNITEWICKQSKITKGQ